MEADDLTYSDVAKRGDMPRSTVHALAKGGVGERTTARPGTLQKLARGLGVELSLVRAAAAETAGYSVIEIQDSDQPADIQALVKVAVQLTPTKRRQLLQMSRLFLDELDDKR